MKHGDQAKAKSAKAVQASGKKVSTAARDVVKAAGKVKSGSKAGKAPAESGEGKGGRKAGPAKAVAKSATRGSSEGAGARSAASNEPAAISNPIIAAAFERAVKKYPNAFRRLTD